jgi:hypothetical protein
LVRRDFRLPRRCKWDLRSSGGLATFRNNISIPKRRDKTTNLRCTKSQKGASLEIYWLCSLHNCITWYHVIKIITYDQVLTN